MNDGRDGGRIRSHIWYRRASSAPEHDDRRRSGLPGDHTRAGARTGARVSTTAPVARDRSSIDGCSRTRGNGGSRSRLAGAQALTSRSRWPQQRNSNNQAVKAHAPREVVVVHRRARDRLLQRVEVRNVHHDVDEAVGRADNV